VVSVPDGSQLLQARRATSLAVKSHNLIGIVEALLDASMLVGTLWVVAFTVDRGLGAEYLVLSVVLVALTFPGHSKLRVTPSRLLLDTCINWVVLFGLLLFFGYATKHLRDFSPAAITLWAFMAPAAVFGAHMAFRASLPPLVELRGGIKRCVIAGMNSQGVALAEALKHDHYNPTRLVGFFDDRDRTRLEHFEQYGVLGRLEDVPQYVRANQIHTIYLSLPMATQPRILKLLDSLRDTTASIYFVPDIFVTDLIQAQMSSVAGLPVVAVCESPFVGLNGFLKRLSDLILCSIILLLISPILIGVALGVRWSSPGPVIFRQRRYGLYGEEITVYKFRSLTVTEDGASSYTQVVKGDARITRFGAFIRKTSLDELPQFFNVFEGSMSIVGPRPHAVAVNEHYRSQITGYMLRHKVRPGITGWAQVNGYRGGDDLDSMKKRIEYDLDYLRNWSLKLDLNIIAKTVGVVFKDTQAF
jgi:putative colanic acid biosynthesis UDP-glucose lipid carrier transferase